MKKLFLLIVLYFGILGVLIYYKMWWPLGFAILGGCIFVFVLFLVVCMDLGFRSKYPLDFLGQTSWVNKYFENRGFKLEEHDTSDSDYPKSIYNNSTYNIEIKLNAPLWKDPPYTITVIVSGAIDKEWNFPAERDDKVFKWFEEIFER